MTPKIEKPVTEEALADGIVRAAIEVHRIFGGAGFLACVYREALGFELEARGFRLRRGIAVPFVYRGRRLETTLAADIIEGTVLVDCRALPEPSPLFELEASKHLRLLDLALGLVINFGLPHLGVRAVTASPPRRLETHLIAERVT